MAFGAGFVLLHAMEWNKLIGEGLRVSAFTQLFDLQPGTSQEYVEATRKVPQFAGTFFTLTGMHMLHVTIGIIYLGAVALRKMWLPILGVLAIACWWAPGPFH